MYILKFLMKFFFIFAKFKGQDKSYSRNLTDNLRGLMSGKNELLKTVLSSTMPFHLDLITAHTCKPHKGKTVTHMCYQGNHKQ